MLARHLFRREPQAPRRDPHPLARADGGWYPGKPFDPTDILTDPKNLTVWRQFLTFFVIILFVPVGGFIFVEWWLRVHLGLEPNTSQTIGALLAVMSLQGVMFYYVKIAMAENKQDYQDSQANEAKRGKEGEGKSDGGEKGSNEESTAPAAESDARETIETSVPKTAGMSAPKPAETSVSKRGSQTEGKAS